MLRKPGRSFTVQSTDERKNFIFNMSCGHKLDIKGMTAANAQNHRDFLAKEQDDMCNACYGAYCQKHRIMPWYNKLKFGGEL